MGEKRFLIDGKKYTLVGSRWFNSIGAVIIDEDERNYLFQRAVWKNRVPVGADDSAGSEGTDVKTVNGKTGPNVILDKSDLGLDLIDNTSDINKPISILTKKYIDDEIDNIDINLTIVEI